MAKLNNSLKFCKDFLFGDGNFVVESISSHDISFSSTFNRCETRLRG